MKKIMAPLLKLHRWLALFLAPVFLLVIVSGGILAFKPIVQSHTVVPVNVSALVQTLDVVDPQGKAGMLSVAADGKSFELRSRGAGPSGTFDIATGQTLEPAGFNIFDFALSLHKNLLVGAGVLVEIATYAMVALLLMGLLLGWPKLRNTVSGWHIGLGWLGLPLVMITPITGLLMALHLGMPSMPKFESADKTLPIARTLEIASESADLSQLSQARSFRRGAVMLSVKTTEGAAMHIVSGTGKLTTSTEGPGWVRMLHEGTWAGAWSGLVNLLSALGLLGLLFTGVWSWWRRRRQARVRSVPSGDPADSTLVAFASQTGTAAKLAEATAQALRAAGESVMLASLAALQPVELAGFRHTLLIASTTGEGELPDPAREFMRKLANVRLQGCHFSLLALGDSRYAAFCGGALKLRTALLERGATEITPVETIDGPAATPWRQWLTKLGRQFGWQDLPQATPELDQTIKLKLIMRERLDNPHVADVRPAWHLRFMPESKNIEFRPGDLLLVSPAKDVVPRCYSIGSSAQTDQGTIDLTVALHTTEVNGELRTGFASGYLCQQLLIGSEITVQLRRHADFNPPADASRPVILIATGAGIAPFPGFLAERRQVSNAGPVWLLFGNRKQQGDFYHQCLFEDCLADGSLTRLDTAFSRDDKTGCHIPQRILENGPELLRWMNECNALIYVCGRAGMGESVELALLEILAEQGLPAGEMLARWKAAGRMKQDLFA